MNLIEQLGGYEKARKACDKEIKDGGYPYDLISALLEHRRDNNIFEVGDLVVLVNYDCHAFGVLIILYCCEEYIHLNNGEKYNENLLRHATPEEIETGNRL